MVPCGCWRQDSPQPSLASVAPRAIDSKRSRAGGKINTDITASDSAEPEAALVKIGVQLKPSGRHWRDKAWHELPTLLWAEVDCFRREDTARSVSTAASSTQGCGSCRSSPRSNDATYVPTYFSDAECRGGRRRPRPPAIIT